MTNEHPQPGSAWTPEPDPNQHPTPDVQDVHPSAEPQDPHAAGYQYPYGQPAYAPSPYQMGAYQSPGYGYGYGYPPPAGPPARRSSRAKRTLVGVGAAALAAGLIASGVVIGHETTSSDDTASSAANAR